MAAALPQWSNRVRFAISQVWTVMRAPLSFARMARRARMIGTTGAPEACARVATPTLVVTGEPALDHVVSAVASTDYVALIRGARGVVLERTGHLGVITQPVAFSTVVRQFVDGRKQQRPDQTEVA